MSRPQHGNTPRMETVRHVHRHVWLSVGVYFVMVFAASWCAAQYPAGSENVPRESYPPDHPWGGFPVDGGNGSGNYPMPPATSSGNLYRPSVGGPPMQPSGAVRGSAWPGALPPTGPGQPTAGNLPAAGQLNACQGTRILAHVGSEVILEGDVSGPVNDFLDANKDRIPPDQVEVMREELIKKQLKNQIQNKLVYLDAKAKIPSEGWSQVEKQLEKAFDEGEIDKLMKRVNVTTRRELEWKLQKLGTSLERERRSFSERELSRQWIHMQVKRDNEVTPDQMIAYYRQHIDEFTTPDRVKWEELMVRLDKYPDSNAAYAAIARMGNQVLAGAKFAEVAKAASDGPTAPNGGAWDWTVKGALVAKEVDGALFDSRLPAGRLSPIIKEPNGYHIIRVTSREARRVMPFLEAQVQIRQTRDKIAKQRFEKQLMEYLAKLEAKTPISTIFDGQKDSDQQMSGRPELRR
jgi:parvulin-like peptidyl-prolyl isomerase